MADRGILPKAMGYRSKYGTPTVGILLSTTGVLCLSWMSFSEVIDMLNVLYCIAQLVEFAAFVQLRIKYPDISRPYKVPLGTLGVSLMLLIPALFCIVIIALSSQTTLVTVFVLTLFGFVLQLFLHVARERGWFVFHNVYCSPAALRHVQAKYDYESIPIIELPQTID